MRLTIQEHDDIPVHIVSSVPLAQQQQESRLAQRCRPLPAAKGKNKHAQLSMGVASSKNDKYLADLQERYGNELPVDDEERDDLTAASVQQYAKHRSTHKAASEHTSDNEEEKENIDISGRQLFGFASKKKRRTKDLQQTKRQKIDDDSSQRRPMARKSTHKSKDSDAEKEASDTEDELDELEHVEEEDDEEEEEEKEANEETNAGQVDSYERYFQAVHGKSVTSNQTLSNLPVLEPEEFEQLLKSAPVKHQREVSNLMAHHERCFPQWYFELCNGFNLMFFGYGSKRQLLNKFAMDTLRDGVLIVANGYFPTMSIKDLLLKILVGAIDVDHVPSNLHDQVNLVRDYFASPKRNYDKLYLVVHNLDGPSLRNEAAQSALSLLAEADNISLVASMDHGHAGLLWDNVKTARFNWVYHNATTFDHYLVETSFEHSLMMQSQKHVGARGIQYVLASLTNNARGIFRLLAEHQLMEMDLQQADRPSENVGLAFHQYYDQCREAFFVSSEIAMRSQLVEFKDHQVITTKRQPDGTEVFFIALDKNTLTDIVANTTE